MNTRILGQLEPSFPWLWAAILTDGPIKSTTGALAQAAKYAKITAQIVSGDLSVFTNFIGNDADVAFSALMQDVQPPAVGYAIQYNDLGFVQYPSFNKIISEPIQTTFIETADGIVSKFFNDWTSGYSSSVVKIGKARSGSVKITERLGTAVFHPPASMAKSLYLIKMRRDSALGVVNQLGDAASSLTTGLISQIKTGFYELPVQVYCYPRVFPQKVQESKLDHTETNSLGTVSVLFERVPLITLPGEEAPEVTELQKKLAGFMGTVETISGITESVMSMYQIASGVAGRVSAYAGVASKRDAEALTNLSKQTE